MIQSFYSPWERYCSRCLCDDHLRNSPFWWHTTMRMLQSRHLPIHIKYHGDICWCSFCSDVVDLIWSYHYSQAHCPSQREGHCDCCQWFLVYHHPIKCAKVLGGSLPCNPSYFLSWLIVVMRFTIMILKRCRGCLFPCVSLHRRASRIELFSSGCLFSLFIEWNQYLEIRQSSGFALFVSICLHPSPSVSVCLHLSPSVSICLYPFITICLCPRLSNSVHLRLWFF